MMMTLSSVWCGLMESRLLMVVKRLGASAMALQGQVWFVSLRKHMQLCQSNKCPPILRCCRRWESTGIWHQRLRLAEAPPPKQGFFICPDRTFNAWWVKHKQPPPSCPNHVIPMLSAMQGHPESLRLWEKHADEIFWEFRLAPTVHETCLYSGTINGQRVLFMQ